MKTATKELATQDKPVAITAIVGRQIEALVARNSINFPSDYDVSNALAAAKLNLQTVLTMDKKPVVDANGRPTGACTESSMVNAVFDMCVQGLNVAKKQGYFIVYGNQLTFQRSYFGDEALAKRVNPDIELFYDVIRDGDTFSIEKKWTSRYGLVDAVKHEKKWPTAGKIIGAYCGAVDKLTGEDMGTIVFDIERIKKSWAQSKTYKPGGSTPHTNFEEEMCLRTIIRRRCKPIINSSSDAHLLQAIKRQDDAILAEIDEQESLNGHAQPISIEALPERESQEVAVETKAPARERVDFDTAVFELDLNADQIQYVKDQRDDYEEFLIQCHADGAQSWRDVSDKMNNASGQTEALEL